MILQELKNYYDRKSTQEGSKLASPGFEKKEIPFLIVLDDTGQFVDLEDTRFGEGKKKRARIFTIPQAVKRSLGIVPNLLWDNVGYVLGYDVKGKPERTQEQHRTFIQNIENIFGLHPTNKGIHAVLVFLKASNFQSLQAHPLWEEIKEGAANLSFRLQQADCLVCQDPDVFKRISEKALDLQGEDGTCLISGELSKIARLHWPIKGVYGAQSTGADIVSFNLDAFTSLGKAQGSNAPMGQLAVFEYTTAANHLLRRGSKQRLQIGDCSTIFWAAQDSPMEDLLADLFGEPLKDDADRNVQAVRSAFLSPKSGVAPADNDPTRFFILGLSPNAKRLSVRFWKVTTVGALANNIRKHFEDFDLVKFFEAQVFPSLYRFLKSVAIQGEIDNVPPRLSGDLMKSILEGKPYPKTLLQLLVRRMKVNPRPVFNKTSKEDFDTLRFRMMGIKACLVREHRYYSKTNKEVGVSLDESNDNVAYCLGRLFSVLEKTQEEASPGLNATIRDRFYGAASSTPVTVFPRLLKLNKHHLSKLEHKGRAVNLEKLIGQIVNVVDGTNGFPTHLSLEDQGRFTIGYYHQRQAFFTKQESSENKGETL